MAITNTQGTNASAGSVASVATGTLTPVANRLWLISVYNVRAGTAPTNPTMSTTTGLTLVLIAQKTPPDIGDLQMSLFRAMKSSGLGAGTFTADFGVVEPAFAAIAVADSPALHTP